MQGYLLQFSPYFYVPQHHAGLPTSIVIGDAEESCLKVKAWFKETMD
jgi:hypothetical protein